jgi:hypothetical protein
MVVGQQQGPVHRRTFRGHPGDDGRATSGTLDVKLARSGTRSRCSRPKARVLVVVPASTIAIVADAAAASRPDNAPHRAA